MFENSLDKAKESLLRRICFGLQGKAINNRSPIEENPDRIIAELPHLYLLTLLGCKHR